MPRKKNKYKYILKHWNDKPKNHNSNKPTFSEIYNNIRKKILDKIECYIPQIKVFG